MPFSRARVPPTTSALPTSGSERAEADLQVAQRLPLALEDLLQLHDLRLRQIQLADHPAEVVLRAGHVPLLAGSHADELASGWGAAALVTATLDGVWIERRATEKAPISIL